MIDLNLLNPPQRAAVEQTEGPLLVLAGAGSGKTRVLTYRVAHLMERGVPAWKILAITFTNKAAREMVDRVSALVGEEADEAWISTFHSCCARILRRDIEKMGYTRQFSIYDSDDSLSAMRTVCKQLNLSDKEYPPKELRRIVSNAKNDLDTITPDDWLKQQESSARNRNIYRAFAAYEAALKGNNALDFDDLLLKTLILLTENPPVLDYYRQKFDYILVDECQDTNSVQYELVALLARGKNNLCMVGDDDQSIYGWRGANPQNIRQFEQDFSGCKLIKLEQNYRSTGTILDAANQVIAHNSGRKEKVLWTDQDDGEKIALYRALDERDEASFIMRMCAKLIANGEKPGEIAVLYRTNAQSRVLEEVFVRGNVPHRIYGGMRFYEREEVKDLLAYLRILVNEDDDVSLRRVINKPRRGIGDSTIDRISEYAHENGISLIGAVQCASDIGLSTRAAKLVGDFGDMLLQLTELAYEKTPSEVLQAVIDQSGYVAQLEKQNDEESKDRLDNIKEFQGAAAEFEKNNPDGGLVAFLENVALFTDVDNIGESDGIVTLMTMHAAKGLEFNRVFIAGMEEGVFPLSRAQFDAEELEEERRLAYVGITRAKKRLYLSCARSRALYNARNFNEPSRFLSEIPERLISTGKAESSPSRLPPPNNFTASRKGAFASHFARTPMTPAPKTASKSVPQYSVGEKVYHKMFGLGEVISAEGSGEAQKIKIHFERGNKVSVFYSASAPLTKR